MDNKDFVINNGVLSKYNGNDALVTVPMGVTKIDYHAFHACTSVESIVLPSSLTHIDTMAFAGCKSLKNLSIPDTIVEVESDFIYGNNDIQYNIYSGARYLGNEHNPYVLLVSVLDKDITSIDIHPDTVVIGSEAFYECSKLSSVVIPDKVVTISYYAFGSCDSLASVTLSKSLVHIEPCAFTQCEKLTSITIPDSVETIGNDAFANTIHSVTLPTSLQAIGKQAFCWSNLEYNEYNGCKYLGSSATPYLVLIGVLDRSIENVVIHDDTIIITDYAFTKCNNLKTVALPEGLLVIGDHAFFECYKLDGVTLPSGLLYIDRGAFYKCTSLHDITIPSSVTDIEEYAFAHCESLSSVVVGGGKVWTGVFNGCTSLVSATFRAVEYIGEYAFSNCDRLETITLPKGTDLDRVLEYTALDEDKKSSINIEYA